MITTGDTSYIVHAEKKVVSSFFSPKGVVSALFSERRKHTYKDNAESTTTKPHYNNNAVLRCFLPSLVNRGLFLPSLVEWGQNIALIRFGMGGYEVLGIFWYKLTHTYVNLICKCWVSAMNYMKNIPYNIYTTSLIGVGGYVCVGIISLNRYVILSNLTHKCLVGVLVFD